MKEIRTALFIKFLKKCGCVRVRTTASHDVWMKKDGSLTRPIIIRGKFKEIPLLHIHTCLKTLGMTKEEFETIINELK